MLVVFGQWVYLRSVHAILTLSILCSDESDDVVFSSVWKCHKLLLNACLLWRFDSLPASLAHSCAGRHWQSQGIFEPHKKMSLLLNLHYASKPASKPRVHVRMSVVVTRAFLKKCRAPHMRYGCVSYHVHTRLCDCVTTWFAVSGESVCLWSGRISSPRAYQVEPSRAIVISLVEISAR